MCHITTSINSITFTVRNQFTKVSLPNWFNWESKPGPPYLALILQTVGITMSPTMRSFGSQLVILTEVMKPCLDVRLQLGHYCLCKYSKKLAYYKITECER